MTDWRDICRQLGRYDTATICNAIELFDIRPRASGFMNGSIRAAFPALPPVVGFAATATCRTAAPRQPGAAIYGLSQQIERFGELSGPPVVVLQDLDEPPLAATFGEIMCTAYRAFGAVGLVTNGPGRDMGQIERLRFPVFTDGAVASHGYFHILDVHSPVQVGGLTVNPDDLLHADRNGVAVVPRAIAERVPAAASALVAAEQMILRALHRPDVNAGTLAAAMAEADSAVTAIRRRLQGD